MAKLSARDKALALAISIVETRAAEVRRIHDGWSVKYPLDSIGAATERSAYMECEMLARLIREKMSADGRAALKATDA